VLFALAFIPQFLVGGLTAILVGNPTIDYHVNNSYFVLATSTTRSWPAAFSASYRGEHLIGVNTAFISFFILGYDGVPRWMATYPAGAGFTTLSLISSIGAGIIGLSMMIFAYNLWISAGSASPRLPIPGRARRWNGSPVLLRRGTTSPWPTPYPGSAATHRCSTCERTPGRAGRGSTSSGMRRRDAGLRPGPAGLAGPAP
jgi:heme/copper-type cytochrome/quinol oxidase subunit 1